MNVGQFPTTTSPAALLRLFLRRRPVRITLLVLCLAGLSAGAYAGIRSALKHTPVFHEHFAVVDPGQLLRSSQPEPEDLDAVLREHGVRTIVILRSTPRSLLGQTWWDRERQWAQARGVHIVHLPCDADSPPTPDQIDAFFALFEDAQRLPVLLHCEAGRHRTGVYAALYGIDRLGWTLEQAREDMDRHGFNSQQSKRQKLMQVVERFAAAKAERLPR